LEFGLPEKTIKLICDLFHRYPEIDEVKVYGSRAMDNYERGSDIDLAFFAVTGERIAERLHSELDELPTPYLFDVTDYFRLSHLPLKEHIDNYGKTIYALKSYMSK